MDVSDIFIFFSSRKGGRRRPSRWRGFGFFLGGGNRGRGGCSPRRRGGGTGAARMSAERRGGELNIFFGGRNSHQVFFHTTTQTSPGGQVWFQNLNISPALEANLPPHVFFPHGSSCLPLFHDILKPQNGLPNEVIGEMFFV